MWLAGIRVQLKAWIHLKMRSMLVTIASILAPRVTPCAQVSVWIEIPTQTITSAHEDGTYTIHEGRTHRTAENGNRQSGLSLAGSANHQTQDEKSQRWMHTHSTRQSYVGCWLFDSVGLLEHHQSPASSSTSSLPFWFGVCCKCWS